MRRFLYHMLQSYADWDLSFPVGYTNGIPLYATDHWTDWLVEWINPANEQFPLGP